MGRNSSYRCLACFEGTLERSFDTSHLMSRCPACEEFGRFVNQAVVDQVEAYDASPPESFDWERLDETEKLFVAERITRTDRTLADFEIVEASDGEQ